MSTISAPGRGPVESVRSPTISWGVPMTLGILLIIAGVFALSAVVYTSLFSVLTLGVLLVIAGVFEIVSAFRKRHNQPFVAYLLTGVLAIVTGAIFIAKPLASLASLTFLIAGFLFASGLFRLVTSLAERYRRWGWDLAYALVTLALGIYVVANWPLSSLVVLGTIVSIEVIARGCTLVAASTVLRNLQHARSALVGAH